MTGPMGVFSLMDAHAQYRDFKWDVAPLPKGPDGTRASLVRPVGFGGFSQSRNPEATVVPPEQRIHWLGQVLTVQPVPDVEAPPGQRVLRLVAPHDSVIAADRVRRQQHLAPRWSNYLDVFRVEPLHKLCAEHAVHYGVVDPRKRPELRSGGLRVCRTAARQRRRVVEVPSKLCVS